MNTIITIFCVIAILLQPLFFSVMGLLGLQYDGNDESNVYVAYLAIVFVSTLMSYIYASIKNKTPIQEIKLLSLFFAIFIIHILWVIFDGVSTQLFPEYLTHFIFLGIPGFLAAATIIKLGLVDRAIKFTEFAFIVIALGLVAFSVIPFLSGIRVDNIGGANYQILSYFSAFTVGMLLFYNLVLPPRFRSRLMTSTLLRVLSYAIILGAIIACFIGSGRGAFLLMLGYFFLIFRFLFFNKENVLVKRKLIQTGLQGIGLVILLSVFFSYFWENEFIQSGFKRATQFISSDGGIDLKHGSSGRDEVYTTALDYILQSPIIGYGPFGFREQTIHAHNLILEIWQQFGILGLFVYIPLFIMLIIRTRSNWDIKSSWAFYLFLYPLVMTMFSGSYLHSSQFMFGVAFFTIYKYKSNQD